MIADDDATYENPPAAKADEPVHMWEALGYLQGPAVLRMQVGGGWIYLINNTTAVYVPGGGPPQAETKPVEQGGG